VIQSLGYQVEKADENEEEISNRRQEILNALEQGEISSKDAIKKLQEFNK
jgi:hypothetical protein